MVLLQCFHVPYSALTMFISREQSERDSATAYRKSNLLPFLLLLSSWDLGWVWDLSNARAEGWNPWGNSEGPLREGSTSRAVGALRGRLAAEHRLGCLQPDLERCGLIES